MAGGKSPKNLSGPSGYWQRTSAIAWTPIIVSVVVPAVVAATGATACRCRIPFAFSSRAGPLFFLGMNQAPGQQVIQASKSLRGYLDLPESAVGWTTKRFDAKANLLQAPAYKQHK
eukprot:GHVT01093925.1.p3 GENE.GHVT01093925.1~~GHVT01093925.1.p3  ORF type:complete len:116 (+),score=25.89 GHVT01093925.1:194-541(+)